MHFAWITAESLVTVNLLVVKMDGSIPVQLAVGLGTLAILHGLAIFVLFGLTKPIYGLPAVFAWAVAAISWKLKKPEASIVERFDSDTITGIRYTAIAVAFFTLFHMLIRRFILCFVNKVCMNVGGYTEVSSDEVKTLELVEAVPAANNMILEHVSNEPRSGFALKA